jgi:NAD+ synthase (glutamine-hydrolysing)
MIRIETAQIDVIPGNVRANWQSIASEIEEARRKKADILVLPELCLSGYLIGDLWDQDAFLRECESYGKKIAAASQGLTIVWGNVYVDWEKIGDDGRPRKYNAAFAAYNGSFILPENGRLPCAIKTLLPNYKEFDDPRYFTSLIEAAAEEETSVSELLSPFLLPIPSTGDTLRTGILLCEDSWDENYRIHPMKILAGKNISLFLNLSASPYTLGKNGKRHRMLQSAMKTLHTPMLYVNQRGLQNNGKTCYTFDGMTASYDAEGRLTGEAKPYTEPRTLFAFNEQTGELAPEEPHPPVTGDFVLSALSYGLSHFLSAIHCDHVVIGVSGGIDSAVNAALYRTVLPADQVLLVNTPTKFNSETTKSLARQLAQNLSCPFITLPIGSFIEETVKQLDGITLSSPSGHPDQVLHLTSFMKENMQARDRSSRILSALSSAFHGIFTCNANKTELTVGYGTLYGDLAGALAATGDLWKHQVYELGRALNEHFGSPVIPEGIFTVKPSAELSEKQDVDKGLGDPLIYEYHDYLLRSFVESWRRVTPEELLTWYAEGSLESHIGCQVSVRELFPTPQQFISDLERWWNLFAGFAVAKRIQAPPILAVSRRPYGFDLRESQVQPYYTDAYLALKDKLLKK